MYIFLAMQFISITLIICFAFFSIHLLSLFEWSKEIFSLLNVKVLLMYVRPAAMHGWQHRTIDPVLSRSCMNDP